MICPRGSPRLTSIPLRTMNGLRTRALVSIAGTSTCQSERSLPLKRLCGCRSDAQRDVESKAVATQTAIRNDFMRARAGCPRRAVERGAALREVQLHAHYHYCGVSASKSACQLQRSLGIRDSSRRLLCPPRWRRCRLACRRSLVVTHRPGPRMQRLVPLALLLASVCVPVAARSQESRVLVFSKTAGFRHSSIGVGRTAIRKLGQENGFAVDATEDAGAFSSKNLARYRAVVFLNTTGDVLDAAQQDDFERYIQAGGGYVGIHSATDTEYDWPWYGRLAGAWFNGHPNNPNVRKGTYHVVDKSHPSTEGFPDTWVREDEFYNFKSIDPTIHVLIEIDEKSYQGGTNGNHHPMSWYHDFDGGRAFYTNMGHTEATFSEPLFLRHLLGGLRYAMGGATQKIDFSRARPEENRFTKVVLAVKLDEPVELAVLPGERVLFIERHGFVNLYTPANGRVRRTVTLPGSTQYVGGSQAED